MPTDTPATLHAGGRDTEIAKLTVFHLAHLVFTETALSGADLEARSDIEKFETSDRAIIDAALEHIERATPKSTDAVCDARWGLVFSDATGGRVRSLYLDKFGTTGELDGTRVALADESLIEWLREQYGEDSVLS